MDGDPARPFQGKGGVDVVWGLGGGFWLAVYFLNFNCFFCLIFFLKLARQTGMALPLVDLLQV